MGLLEKLFDTRRAVLSEDLVDDTNDVLLDVTRARSINRSSSVTEHAVEVGAPITDNKKNNPVEISIDILLTDNKDLLTLVTLPGRKDRFKREEQLLKWWNESTPIYLIAPDVTYSSLVIKDMNSRADKGEGKAISYSLSLKEITIATGIVESVIKDKGTTDPVIDPRTVNP